MEEELTFTGVWIPAKVMLDSRLKSTDKILYAEIACFGDKGCFKKSEDLYERLGVCEKTFKVSMARLVKLGYVETQKLNNGRVIRRSTLRFAMPEGKNYPMACGKLDPQGKNYPQPQGKNYPQHNKNTNKNIVSKDTIGAEAPSVPVENSEKPDKSNPEINEMFDYWKEKTNLPIASKVKMNRNACHNLLRRYGIDKLKGLVRIVAISQEKPYAPSVGDFIKLQEKQNDLLIWYKKERKNISALRAVKSPVCDSVSQKVNLSSLNAAKALERKLEALDDKSNESQKLTKQQLQELRDRALK